MKGIKRKKGFTLVEVVIVIAIISIILSIIIPTVRGIKLKSQRKSDIQTCKTIKDITNILLVEEKIKWSNSNEGFIVIDCIEKVNDNNSFSITGLIEPSSVDVQIKLQEYFTGVNAPQQNKGGGYTIVISKKGDVEAVIANEHKPGKGIVGDMITDTFVGTVTP